VKSYISVGNRFAVEKQPVDYFEEARVTSGRFLPLQIDTGRKKWFASAAKSACAGWCVLVFFSYVAQAQPSISGFLVNGIAASGGPVGVTLTIQGSGFGTTQGFSTATLNGTAIAGNGVKANGWSDTSIVTLIPTNATSGPVVVKVRGKASNGLNFTVAPAINSLSPPSGQVGTSVTIDGNNFASLLGDAVTFNGVSSTPSSWSTTKIVAPVPWTTSGKVVVTVGGVQSNAVNFAIAAPAATGTPGTGTFFVNRTDDPPVPVDLTQFCQNTSNIDMSSPCSLREAIVEANGDANDSSSLPDTIMLEGKTYHLYITGTGTTNATTGHLDITNPVTIVGTGATTIIQADPALKDQIFLIDAAEEGSIGFPVAISNLVIQGGQVNPTNGLVTSGGGFLWEAGTDGTGQLKLTNVTVNGNTATDPVDPGVDDGGGMALFNTAGVTTPAQVNITGSAIQNNQALDAGGGIALKGAISLSMSKSTVTGNQAVGGGIQEGGGLFLLLANNPPAGGTSSPSFIQHSTFSSNIAGSGALGEGGAVRTDQSLTINQGSVINGNNAGGTGGGIAIAVAGASDQVVISSSTISSNTSSGSGAGIEIDANTNSNASLQFSFNRIVGNTVGSGSTGTGLVNQGTGTVGATDNWWGCNQGPQSSSSGCDSVSGTVTSSPWIILTDTASPGAVLNGTPTTLTASFLQDSSNAILSASNLIPLIGLSVGYPSVVNGTLSSQEQTTIQPNGTATATFTTSGTGTASSEVQVDNATVTATVSIQDFTVSVASVTVNNGSTTASLTVAVSSVNGFNGVVTLACSTLPAGITCPSGSFNPPTVTGSGTSILTVSIDTGVAPGTLGIPVTGTSSNIPRGGSGSLTLADFSLSISPPSVAINLGQTATYTVTCSTSTGFSGPVQLSSTLGGTSFNPNPVNCPGTSQLTVNPTASGNFNVTVSGTFGTAPPRGTGASLTVQDFSVGVSPATVNVGSTSATLTVTVSSVNGFNGVVTLACGTLRAGITCPSESFNPATVIGAGTSTLTVNIASSVAPGTYGIPVMGTSISSSRNGSGNLTLTAPAASLSPTSLSFGNQHVGTSSAAQTVTLSNTGNGSLTINSIAATGDFAVQTNNTTNPCLTSLAPENQCTISVTFTPTATGTRNGTLSVTNNDLGSPQTAILSGTGIVPAPGVGFVIVSGSGACDQNHVCDSGTLSVTVNGTQVAALGYGDIEDPSVRATSLRDAINANNAWVTASCPLVSGTQTCSTATITLTAQTAGPNTNYPLSVSTSHNFSTTFPFPTVTLSASGPTLTGGQ
jgi:CSLREA domain-containing protein